MAWYKTGFAQPEMQGGGKRQKNPAGNRVWVRPGTKEQGMFLDNNPYCVNEHNPYLDGHYRNWHTCPGADCPEGCPPCEVGDEPYYVGFLSWASFTPWKDSKGIEHTFTKKLFPMKQKVWKIMSSAVEKRGDLTGWVVECERFSNEEPVTGLKYDFEEKIEKAEWKAKFGSRIITYGDQTIDTYLQPIDYEKVLAPKSYNELKRLANRLKYKTGAEDDDGGTAAEDDIPF